MKANSKTKLPAKAKKVKSEIIPDAPEGMSFPEFKSEPKKIVMPDINEMLNKNSEFRDEPQKREERPNELKVYSVNTIVEDEPVWGTAIQLTPWVNGTGYEIILCNKNGAFQHLSLTKEDVNLINRMVRRLSNV